MHWAVVAWGHWWKGHARDANRTVGARGCEPGAGFGWEKSSTCSKLWVGALTCRHEGHGKHRFFCVVTET